MADQRDEAVRKGAHWAWQIHYHIVFPVKYRKSLLDEVVTTIIEETAAEIAERFPIEMEAIWNGQESYPSALQCTSESGSRPDCADLQEHHGAGDLSPKACGEAGTVGRGVLDRRVLSGQGRGTGQLVDGRTVCPAARATSGRSPSAPNVLVP